jgi:single-strand DNA-binding protein
MSKSLNKVMLIGNLTRDPELRYTPSSTAVCTFSIATNRNWSDASGQKQEDVQFHRLVAWGKLGEICAEILHKGRKVYVQGRLQTRNWQTNEGQERQTTEIVVDEMIALGAPKDGSSGGGFGGDPGPTGSGEVFNPDGEVVKKDVKTAKVPGKTANSSTGSKPNSSKVMAEDINDDIPF